ncbi:hypothetical protein MJD09_22055 [bacterium]|nr:hypothetical protein [bacterium]
MQCYRCRTVINLDGKPGRNETCPKCHAYLHSCLNCNFYDPNAHNQCREPQAEWVKDKEMGNFCDYYDPASQAKSSSSDRKEDALKKLNDLFKKK